MIGLRRYSTDISLPQKSVINYEVEHDFLDFELINNEYTWQFKIPIEGNESLFGFAHDPSNPKNQLKEYDGFFISIDGMIWRSGVFNLDDIDDEYFIGSFSVINSELYKSKDFDLTQVITKQLDIIDGTFDEFTADWNNENYPEMVFPRMQIKDDIPFYVNDKGGNICPCFGIQYLIKICCEQFGYKLIDNYSSAANRFKQLIIIPDKFIPNIFTRTRPREAFANNSNSNSAYTPRRYRGSGGGSGRKSRRLARAYSTREYNFSHISNKIDVAYFMPEGLTFYELVSDYAKVTCSDISIDPVNQTLSINSINRLLNKTSLEIGSNFRFEGGSRIDVKELKLIWNLDDELFDDVEEELQGTYKGEFDDLNDATANIVSPEIGDYVFLLRDNAYYQVQKTNPSEIDISSTSGEILPHLILTGVSGSITTADILTGDESGAKGYVSSYSAGVCILFRHEANRYNFKEGEAFTTDGGASGTIGSVHLVLVGEESNSKAEIFGIDGSTLEVFSDGAFIDGETISNGSGSATADSNNGSLLLQYYTQPYQKFKYSKIDDIRELILNKLQPVKFDRYEIRTLTKFTVSSSGGSDIYGAFKVKIEFDEFSGLLDSSMSVFLVPELNEESDAMQYPNKWIGFHLENQREIYLDEAYLADVTVKTILIRVTSVYYTPIVSEKHEPKIAYYHGLQPDTNQANNDYTYYLAAPHNYNAESTKLPGYALRNFQSENIQDAEHEVVNAKLKNTRLLKFESSFDNLEIEKVIASKKIQNRDATIILSKLSFEITDRGLENQKGTAYKV